MLTLWLFSYKKILRFQPHSSFVNPFCSPGFSLIILINMKQTWNCNSLSLLVGPQIVGMHKFCLHSYCLHIIENHRCTLLIMLLDPAKPNSLVLLCHFNKIFQSFLEFSRPFSCPFNIGNADAFV